MRVVIPWLGVVFQPDVTFLLPDCKFASRHGIAETGGDKLHHLTLLPVGDFVPMGLDFLAAIQKITHASMLGRVDNARSRSCPTEEEGCMPA